MPLLSISLSLSFALCSCHYIHLYIPFDSLEVTTTILSIDQTHQDNNIATSVSICLLRHIRCGLFQVDGDDDWHEKFQLVFPLSLQTTTLNSNPLKCFGLSVRDNKYWCTMAERVGMFRFLPIRSNIAVPSISFHDLGVFAPLSSLTPYHSTLLSSHVSEKTVLKLV